MTATYAWGAALLLLLTACGNKPDGTPYGVNPAKHPNGHHLADSTNKTGYNTGTGMPKGAEMNAVTSGAKAGAPPQDIPQ